MSQRTSTRWGPEVADPNEPELDRLRRLIMEVTDEREKFALSKSVEILRQQKQIAKLEKTNWAQKVTFAFFTLYFIIALGIQLL